MDNDVFIKFLKKLESLGYVSSHSVIKCEEVGAPQKRRRLVLMASRITETSPQIKSTTKEIRSVKEAFAGLRKLEAGDIDDKDPLHRCASLSKLNLQGIRASTPGGTWKEWPQALRLECHKKSSGSKYTPVYGRLEWGRPAPTITTQCYNYGSGRFGHPKQDRPISLREAAILQGFPKNYEFEESCEKMSMREIAKMIGNAVPVDLGFAIGKAFLGNIEENKNE